MKKKYKAYRIEWDYGDEPNHPILPDEMIVELDDNDDPSECVADALTDKTGWLVVGCKWEEVYDESVNPIFIKLSQHVGHTVEVVGYGIQGRYQNISIECVDCNEVLYDVDKYEETDTGRGDM